MGSTQKYSLKWNDFTVNVASTFRDLHSRHDFVDVTLACADGSTLEAHKVILSSVSSYFRDILKVSSYSSDHYCIVDGQEFIAVQHYRLPRANIPSSS